MSLFLWATGARNRRQEGKESSCCGRPARANRLLKQPDRDLFRVARFEYDRRGHPAGLAGEPCRQIFDVRLAETTRETQHYRVLASTFLVFLERLDQVACMLARQARVLGIRTVSVRAVAGGADLSRFVFPRGRITDSKCLTRSGQCNPC